jgi:hypothetical protein
MAYVHTAPAPQALAFERKTARQPARSLLNRLFHYIAEANQRRAEQEIARYLESTGGKFTDAAEREIEERYLANVVR